MLLRTWYTGGVAIIGVETLAGSQCLTLSCRLPLTHMQNVLPCGYTLSAKVVLHLLPLLHHLQA